MVTKIYEALYPENPNFNTNDILNLLEEKPEFKNINSDYKCNEGLEKSLQADEAYLKTIRRKKADN